MKLTKDYLRDLIRENLQEATQPLSQLKFYRDSTHELASMLADRDYKALYEACRRAFENTYGSIPENYIDDNPIK